MKINLCQYKATLINIVSFSCFYTKLMYALYFYKKTCEEITSIKKNWLLLQL